MKNPPPPRLRNAPGGAAAGAATVNRRAPTTRAGQSPGVLAAPSLRECCPSARPSWPAAATAVRVRGDRRSASRPRRSSRRPGRVDAPVGSAELRGRLDQIPDRARLHANGPWWWSRAHHRGAMPKMLAHRRAEAAYYRDLFGRIAELGGYDLDLRDTPERWEGMADVAVVGDRVVLTYAVPGHYDAGMAPKSPRSSREGVSFAADVAGVPEAARIHAAGLSPLSRRHGPLRRATDRRPSARAGALPGRPVGRRRRAGREGAGRGPHRRDRPRRRGRGLRRQLAPGRSGRARPRASGRLKRRIAAWA